MFEIAILYVISVLVSGCSSKNIKSSLKIKNEKAAVKDIDNNDVTNIEKIKKGFKLKDVKDLIFIPIKKNRCIIWNNYFYKHAVYSEEPRIMIGPIDKDGNLVGGAACDDVDNYYYEPNQSIKYNTHVPIRYSTDNYVNFHHDIKSNKNEKLNRLSMIVYLNEPNNGYFILKKNKECVKTNIKVQIDGTGSSYQGYAEIVKCKDILLPDLQNYCINDIEKNLISENRITKWISILNEDQTKDMSTVFSNTKTDTLTPSINQDILTEKSKDNNKWYKYPDNNYVYYHRNNNLANEIKKIFRKCKICAYNYIYEESGGDNKRKFEKLLFPQ